jgi:hypothetical protein
VWLIILSDQLSIVALVSLYPTNKLIERRLLPRRLAPLDLSHHAVLAVVSHSCPPPQDRYLRVTHPSATDTEVPVRLACVKHAASVRSEPGSNSQVHLRLRHRDKNSNERRSKNSIFQVLDLPHNRGNQTSQAFCNASKRYIAKRPLSQQTQSSSKQTNLRQSIHTKTKPLTKPSHSSRRRNVDAANVSLPSICNFQRAQRQKRDRRPRTVGRQPA